MDGMTDKLLATARERFKRALEAEAENRRLALEDLRFGALEQWPEQVRRAREQDPNGARPCLTVDKLNQYVHQVKNDQRQNRPSIKVRPVDDGADPEVAELLQGIIRHIEDQSNADVAYDTAFESAVRGGFGYFRIITEYCDPQSFDQDIRIKRIRNPFTVYMDPDASEPDASDARFCFLTEWLSKDEFEALYPKADTIDWSEAGQGDQLRDWVSRDRVRIAEYFHVIDKPRTLALLADGSTAWADEVPAQLKHLIQRTRESSEKRIQWAKIAGNQVLESREWPGKWIPVVPVIGNELDIEGERRLSGLIRAAKDSQRMYNYQASAFVEAVALAPKAPYIAADGQIEDYEAQWRAANISNIPVLKYRPVDVAGNMVPPPLRQPFAGVPVGIAQGMQNAEHDIQGALGMYNASLGERSNEKSGKAIMARQREGDTATFHYTDNLTRAIRHAGRIIVELIPKIYDTARLVRILGDDGTPDQAALDPMQEMPVRHVVDEQGQVIQRIYNVGLGRYDVSVTAGPSYTTRRQEAADGMLQMIQAAPQTFPLIGDLLVRSLDWPGADEIAERLKKMLPPPLQDQPQGMPGEMMPPGRPDMPQEFGPMPADPADDAGFFMPTDGLSSGEYA